MNGKISRLLRGVYNDAPNAKKQFKELARNKKKHIRKTLQYITKKDGGCSDDIFFDGKFNTKAVQWLSK